MNKLKQIEKEKKPKLVINKTDPINKKPINKKHIMNKKTLLI